MQTGVSRELAQLRKEQIGDLRYELWFDIPEQSDESVDGRVAIRFTLDNPQDVVVDYRTDESSIRSVVVNGIDGCYDYINEHIVVDAEHTRQGENDIVVEFCADDQSLNRTEKQLYTLLVPDRARTLFPCFDQPDMKAEFTLHLTMPSHWIGVSNTNVDTVENNDTTTTLHFQPTEPLSTYLFSFVAGEFVEQSYDDGEHVIKAYYRASDADRTAQLDTIFDQIIYSLEWLEEYTGIDYPFAKYDIVIIPGFQYGGMEHTGATLYNESRMFLDDNPSPHQLLERANVIAHETAHMWFGDYVTMEWFDDVWTKEVFAGYFASRIVEPQFPDIDHTLSWLATVTYSSLFEDRTDGTTPIKQELDNLQNAGLVYGNIIYNKAPIMMLKLVELMGEDAFREGICEYLRTYAYGNATWEELVAILDSHSQENIEAFSKVWVHQYGMPHLSLTLEGDLLRITQEDKWQRDLLWPQNFEVMLVGDGYHRVEVSMMDRCVEVKVPADCRYIVPNSDGRGYGHFITDATNRAWMMANVCDISDDMARCATLITLNENYENNLISHDEWLEVLARAIGVEQNVNISYLLSSYLKIVMRPGRSELVEELLWQAYEEHSSEVCKKYILDVLVVGAYTPSSCDRLYQMWERADNLLLGVADYMTLSYELALRFPERSHYIVDIQTARLEGDTRLDGYRFMSQAVLDGEADAHFEALMDRENRTTEPWVGRSLALLNHPLREADAVKYIEPGLDILQEIQRTGDIFFPANWSRSLLGRYGCAEALDVVNDFLNENPDYPKLLRNKILQAMWRMQREVQL